MNTYVIDSYTWVEYLIGTQKGEVLRGLFQDEKNSFFTVECCLAEIAGWALRNNKNLSSFSVNQIPIQFISFRFWFGATRLSRFRPSCSFWTFIIFHSKITPFSFNDFIYFLTVTQEIPVI